MPGLNYWEDSALDYHFDTENQASAESGTIQPIPVGPKDSVHDAIIYPGLYAPSGYDMMNILVRVMSRANPIIELGAIDASCALILCDLQQPDCPVVYANDPFVELTGYSQREVIGRNCRFMQAPGGTVRKSSARKHVDKDTIKKMRRAVERNEELAVEVVNFKKNGRQFINLLAMIPICWNSAEPKYSVGFQAEKTW
ncbi:vivid PAS protein VVD [Pseudomassariella vexata]|uniref:Vivid PAS protein VVD n=1 Tax=Pseudomassariella vexata TaxID=1141098 RepID=A0A1Y2DPT9_9PEZI|nr:vivid PAS protein VVD [Pseudomassariella vexata]ORY61302.1 vivid PAS protein VVD [Pseudomassariella vexata]